MFQKHGINDLVLVGANDALYAIDFILENDLPVLLNNLHRVPSRNHEDVDLPYKLPYLLQKEGVLVGLTASGSLHSQRNLPFLAGTAAGYGLGKEEALKLITSNNAKILGIDNVTGTIMVGKDANIIISKGDILDMKSSVIEYAFITGRKVNLDGKQQILYDRFKRKYSK
jgi:imidazolonepropionase-like amidohydrolase